MDEESKKRTRKARIYPKKTLKEALQIALSIRDNNTGEPYNKIDLAKSIDSTPSARLYQELVTASSGSYNLTVGSYAQPQIALSDLGRKIVYPLTDEERNEGILSSLESIPLFKSFIEKFDQNRLPREDLLKNNLVREFQVPEKEKDDCYSILMQNLQDWKLLQEVGNDLYLRRDRLSSAEIINKETQGEKIVDNNKEDIEIESQKKESFIEEPKVFISHSKNKMILEQIKQILKFGLYKSVIAEEQETTSIPIPEKIFGLMRECNCAIINVSADEQLKNANGSYNVNPNVLIEIGAAFLGYNKRVILLWDKRVPVPSNLQGLYRVEYEGDELTWSAGMKLQEALTDFRSM